MNFEMVVQTVKGVVPDTRFGATRAVDALVSKHPRDAQKVSRSYYSLNLLLLFSTFFN